MKKIYMPVVKAALLVAALLAAQPAAAQFCWLNCDFTRTKNPVVLQHGLAGFNELGGVLPYWNGIPESLRSGGAEVFVTQVSPFNSSVVRGESLIVQLDEIRAIKGKPALKFNLIGHSQGGLDIRYVAAVRPDLVASLTTVGSPHKGSDLITFDINGQLVPTPAANAFSNFVSMVWASLGGSPDPVSITAVLKNFSPAGIAAFNASFPAGMPTTSCGQGAAVTQTSAGPIRNYSWSGTAPFTNVYDPGDPALVALSLFYDEPNDGLVEACASHFGTVIRDDYRMNHLDEVNNLFGLTSVLEVDPRTLYRNHANRLKTAGL
ncbi:MULTISPECIES: triacylglycerol lipase [unclassified Sphingopyxis]|uniref:esterase/lipase family protein n=1 Tax=unclassified Sphingopyxis TaxID=2614943 RepID=UPI00285CDFE3|nr:MULTISPECIES: triacylglycerol lipase [unclassified Sphingopyxis]MDR6834123.1 triacylglycerol lipase [Sphingopyxis sp. BE122]MDR7226391.1 triacylglycerol lipase [Sphingopyxis sp. BE259]